MPSAFLLLQLPRLANLEWDLAERETHTTRSRVTEHPVEDGSTISDHVFQDPAELELELMHSDSPMPSRITVASINDPAFRAEDMYDALIALQKSATPFTVVTSFKSYDNMLITAVVVPRDACIGNSLQASISLKQIKTTRSQVTLVPAPDKNKSASLRGQNQVKQGEKPSDPSTDAIKNRANSALADILIPDPQNPTLLGVPVP